jgi:hypothetical protein
VNLTDASKSAVIIMLTFLDFLQHAVDYKKLIFKGALSSVELFTRSLLTVSQESCVRTPNPSIYFMPSLMFKLYKDA